MPGISSFWNHPQYLEFKVNSFVYEYLVRHGHHEIAEQFEKFGPFLDLNRLKLEDVHDYHFNDLRNETKTKPVQNDYSKSNAAKNSKAVKRVRNENDATSSKSLCNHLVKDVRSQPKTKRKENHVPKSSVIRSRPVKKARLENDLVSSNDSYETNGLVYDYLKRNSHEQIANDFLSEFGPFEKPKSLKLEDVYANHLDSMNNNRNETSLNKEEYFKIVSLNEEFKDVIRNFTPEDGSQLDQVVQYLITENLKTYAFSLILNFKTLCKTKEDFPWIYVRRFSMSQGGEKDLVLKNYETILQLAKISNPLLLYQELCRKNAHTWKLKMFGTYLSSGLEKVRHVMDTLSFFIRIKDSKIVYGKLSEEENEIILREVEKYGANDETWNKLKILLNRSCSITIKTRYEVMTMGDRKLGIWSLCEVKILIDTLFPDSTSKNEENVMQIGRKQIRELGLDQTLKRGCDNIKNFYFTRLQPLLLQYHQGTLNMNWKLPLLNYVCENKVMDPNQIDFDDIQKAFPFICRSMTARFLSSLRLKSHTGDTPLYIAAEKAIPRFKNRPAHKNSTMEFNEKIIEYYDPSGEFKASNKHGNDLQSL